MVPAPAQGAMLIVTKKEDTYSYNATNQLNHNESQICIQIERAFLKTLEGGCTAPIGASAEIKNNHINFKGVLLALDGSYKIEVNDSTNLNNHNGFGEKCARHILQNGGKELMAEIETKSIVKILSTKSINSNQKERFNASGIEIIDCDAISINPLDFDNNIIVPNAIITSQNAAQIIINNNVFIKNCFCVGNKTKTLLRVNGTIGIVFKNQFRFR